MTKHCINRNCSLCMGNECIREQTADSAPCKDWKGQPGVRQEIKTETFAEWEKPAQVTPIPKIKKKRTKSKKEDEELNTAIHNRDGGKCILCGKTVPLGQKWHHVKQGSNKEDKIEYGVTLCYQCHISAHGGKKTGEVKHKCMSYLTALYGPEIWEGCKK